jgi:putative ABC transport system ATP-binding protein
MIAQPLILDRLSRSVLDSGHDKPTLAPLSRRFDPGQLHVVSGPSGAGKTTLLSLLALAVPPSAGTMHWGQTDLAGLAPVAALDWRRRHLGMIFQTSRLVSVMNALENVCFGGTIRGLDVRAEGLRLLESFGMGSRKAHYPAQLSGGEKQRVAIAQALACRPALLLADEPTANLDAANASFVADTLKSYAKTHSATVICVSHDSTVIDAADDVLHLERP